MNEFWKALIINLGGYTIFTAGLVWLLKSLLSHWLNKDVERFKATLKAQADIASEQLKAQLRMVAYEHEVKFARFHGERAEAVKQIHSLLAELLSKSEIYLLPGSVANRTLGQETGERMNNLRTCFNQNRIYLNVELCKRIDDLLNRIRDSVTKRMIVAEWQPQSEEEAEDWRRILIETYGVIIKEVPPIQRRLEEEFRKTLSPNSSAGT